MFPVLCVLFFFLITGRSNALAVFSPEVLSRLRCETHSLTPRARNALFFVALSLFIVALAQPVIEEGRVKIKAKSADIMIALDISDSMLCEDSYPNRLEAAKRKVLDLLEQAPKERIGVMAFAKEAYLVAPLSFDHRAVRFLLQRLQTGSITEKGTDYLHLIDTAANTLRSDEGRYLLLLTDGGDEGDFSEAIALAKEQKITVFVLGMGSRQGAPIKLSDGSFVKQGGNVVISRLNDSISAFATQTGGAYIEAVGDGRDIEAMMREIEAKTERRVLKEEEVVMYQQLFYWPLGMALLMLLIAFSSLGKRRTMAVPVLVAMVAGLHVSESHAGLLDFQLLSEAKARYETGDFNQSAQLFDAYAKNHPSAEVLYNRAGAAYKAGNYDEAAATYEQLRSSATKHRFEVLHNLGNSYAKKGDAESLAKALKAYEEALSLKEEQPTKENLEAVKKALEEMQKQQQEQQNQQCDNPKEGETQRDDQNATQDGEQKEPQQGDQGGERQKSEPQEGADQKGEQSQKQEPQETPQQEDQQQEAKPQEAQSKDAPDANATQSPQSAAAQSEQMSDMEARKWLEMLQNQPVGHLYRLGEPNSYKRDQNDKPW